MNGVALSSLPPAASLTPAALAVASAQSLEDLNHQWHGNRTQALVRTSQNNILTTNSLDRTAAWFFERAAPLEPVRFFKDWALTTAAT